MADDLGEERLISPHEADVVTRRPTYERPVLRHLGSVNRMTLAQSHRFFSDGIKTKPTRGGG